MAQTLVLDAMGVLYQAGDDVAELLVPFVRQHGNAALTADIIDRDYTAASLGEMSAAALWGRLGVDPALEDDYLAGHRLIDGTADVLPALKKRFGRLACLSNDVSNWSEKLRLRFGLEHWIDAWFISGDLGFRKPSPEIYTQAMAQLGVEPGQVVFVDDRPRNLDAAQRLGMRTVLFDPQGAAQTSSHRKIGGLAELL